MDRTTSSRRGRAEVWIKLAACVLCAMACLVVGGCATQSRDFIVDTSTPDPLIFPPGSTPRTTLTVSLEGFALSCDEAVAMAGNARVAIRKRPWSSSNGLREAPLASISKDDTVKLADGIVAKDKDSGNALRWLREGIAAITQQTPPGCSLTRRGTVPDAVPQQAADIIWNQLPRRYSAMLRSAYNHRVQSEGKTTASVTIDLSAGMRLRIENSLSISPEGVGMVSSYPASFAAPTYLYFHAITGAELCDPGASADGTDDKYICNRSAAEREAEVFLSPSSGLARLGLMQTFDPISGTEAGSRLAPPVPKSSTITFYDRPTSSLIDLMERPTWGVGAHKFWRLWLPANRTTVMATQGSEIGGGSPDTIERPLLMSAARLEDFGSVTPAEAKNPDADASVNPCAIKANVAPVIRCYRLHYRVVPVPEISVMVNGAKQWMPIGSTLLDLVAERLHNGFLGYPNHFTFSPNTGNGAGKMTINAGAAAAAALADIEVLRHDGGGAHRVLPSQAEDPVSIARFLRLQILPGDEIKWK